MRSQQFQWFMAPRNNLCQLLGYEGLEVINPEGGKDDAEEEAERGRWKQKHHGKYLSIMPTKYQHTWKPFNPILGETCEMVSHGSMTFSSEQVCQHPPMSAGHADNGHFTYDVTSKLKTKLLGNSLDVYFVYPASYVWSSLSLLVRPSGLYNLSVYPVGSLVLCIQIHMSGQDVSLTLWTISFICFYTCSLKSLIYTRGQS